LQAREKMISVKILEAFQNRFIHQYCEPESIRRICAYENRLLERIANVNEEVLQARHKANQQIIRLLKNRTAFEEELAGFYLLYPISAECEKLIDGGQIIQSSQILDTHICEANRAASYYLSMVYGRDRAAQAYLIHLIFKDLKAAVISNRKIQFIYVRPVTEAGFRVVEKHNFLKFREDSGIYRRIVTDKDLH
jgi:hypothetical protein